MPQTTTRPANDNIGRLQQEAMARMMGMQQAGTRGGWSTDPNVPRQNRAPRREQPEPSPSAAHAEPQTPPRPDSSSYQNNHPRNQQSNQRRPSGGGPSQQHSSHTPPPNPEPAPKKSDTTLLQDILNAVGLDDDRVLILGLILILINSKADTTLILALCYLLL
ncbi:MAG: hypothetical protein ACOX0K_08015 [Oscillospiraceae bacterium]|jgi:hypothetical protein